MPTYKFYNSKTGEEETHFLHISQLDNFKLENPHLKQMVHGIPGFLGVYNPQKKMSSDFKDRLKEIKRDYKDSTIKTY